MIGFENLGFDNLICMNFFGRFERGCKLYIKNFIGNEFYWLCNMIGEGM